MFDFQVVMKNSRSQIYFIKLQSGIKYLSFYGVLIIKHLTDAILPLCGEKLYCNPTSQMLIIKIMSVLCL